MATQTANSRATKGKAPAKVALVALPQTHDQAMHQLVSLAARIARNKRLREQQRAAA